MTEHACVSFFVTSRKIINFFYQYAPLTHLYFQQVSSLFKNKTLSLKISMEELSLQVFAKNSIKDFLKNEFFSACNQLSAHFCRSLFIWYVLELLPLWSRLQFFIDDDTHLSVTNWISWQSWFFRLLKKY